MSLTFQEYSKTASLTAKYPRGKVVANGYLVNLGLDYLIKGLCGESGEVAEKLKKIGRDKLGQIEEPDRLSLLKELGDVVWYVDQMAKELDSSLEEVARINNEKLLKRLEDGKIHGSGDNR